ncbi:MAG TPA: inorganic phosphate transporter [Capsulimonadaceae bacterium]|nr:inorganic phosphate transporter [Capsulimonadaceae bacterium]
MPEAAHLAPLLIVIVACALVFNYINGFHDSANAIATVVSTRVLGPRTAIVMAAVLNLVGSFIYVKVATTIAKGLVYQQAATQDVLLAAILGAIAWNLITWRYGIPSSSSHALIGGLCGAAIVRGGFGAVIWKGLVGKVVLPLILSPIVGFGLGFVIMTSIYFFFARASSGRVADLFRHLQIVSAAAMALNHGLNDAQKTMGIITLTLVTFGVTTDLHPPLWVMIVCATAMGLGTAAGGWRIIRTMGQRIIRLVPVQGFSAETAASITIYLASLLGMPVSTTHVISGSIFGVGASKRLSAVRWGVAQTMVIAWVLTLPAAGLVAGAWVLIFRALHLG